MCSTVQKPAKSILWNLGALSLWKLIEIACLSLLNMPHKILKCFEYGIKGYDHPNQVF